MFKLFKLTPVLLTLLSAILIDIIIGIAVVIFSANTLKDRLIFRESELQSEA